MLSVIYDSILDPGTDEWIAVKVYRDGNPIELGRFATEQEADDCVTIARQTDKDAHG